MKLDICAPQVIFPDDFQSGDPMLVVVDLGRILLTNSQGKTINPSYTIIRIQNIYSISIYFKNDLNQSNSNSAHAYCYLKMTLRPAQKLRSQKGKT